MSEQAIGRFGESGAIHDLSKRWLIFARLDYRSGFSRTRQARNMQVPILVGSAEVLFYDLLDGVSPVKIDPRGHIPHWLPIVGLPVFHERKSLKALPSNWQMLRNEMRGPLDTFGDRIDKE